jgi:tripeptidyl-peptidase-1
MLTLINGDLMARGRPPLGFVNPLLYKLRKMHGVFRDITKGRNNCASNQNPFAATCCVDAGFSATVGYDPVTGLGSVNFTAFRQAILEYHGQ